MIRPTPNLKMRRITFATLILTVVSWTFVGSAAGSPSGAVILEDRFGHQFALVAGQSLAVGQYGLGELASVRVAKGYRATVCENAGVRARCRGLVGPTGDVPTVHTPPFTAVGTVVTVEKALFGFADLHVHPATHLAWGARGGFGLQWGQPGMAHTTASAAELQKCLQHDHSFTVDPIEFGARFAMINVLGEGAHDPYGYPTFSGWPSGASVMHQQMHVSMLRRAWEGGLRLMVASATDNQMLDIIWNPHLSLSQRRFALREDFDYKAAQEQFEFIRQFVAAKASWMAIVRNPEEARLAINQNKLAVVLGLEMDELTTEEILALQAEYGVALVIPVHLVNNSFGGAAVYTELFNVANYVMNGDFFRVYGDPTLGFRFPGLPAGYTSIPIVGDLLGKTLLGTRLAEYGSTGSGGHRNRVGLLDEYGLRRLMKAGLLIDTAHMSAESTDNALDLAEPFGYPLVHSHGGLRRGDGASERSMSAQQFDRLAASGGILGLGTGSDELYPAAITEWLDHYLDVAGGAVALGTDLNGMAEQIRRSEFTLPYPVSEIQAADWTGWSQPLGRFQLGAKQFDISRDGIAHIGMLPDFLAVVRQYAGPLGRVPEVDEIFHSAHDFIATWEQARRAAPSVNSTLPAVYASSIRLTIETGTDNLKCGGVMVQALNNVDGQDRTIGLSAISGGQPAHATYTMQLPIMSGNSLRDIDKVRFDYLPNKCDTFDTGDTWNIKRLLVTYDVTTSEGREQGVLMHKRGAPAKKLNRGSTWTVYTER